MHSGQLGAPQMNGASGSNGQLLQILDACLINGFNTQTVVSTTKTATTVTFTYGVNHGYVERQLVQVLGASDVNLNSKHRIVALTENTITINATGINSISGSITTKVAPLGFQSIFGNSDPLKRAYRSANPESTQTVLYLDMAVPAGGGYHSSNPAKVARVSFCENMTELGVQIGSYSDVINDYPNNVNGKLFWYQAKDATESTSVTTTQNGSWVVFGNEDYFYFMPEWTIFSIFRGQKSRDFYGFGDIPSLSGVEDNFSCVWIGSYNKNNSERTNYATSNAMKVEGNPSSVSDSIGYFISNKLGVGGAQPMVMSSSCNPSQPSYFSGASGLPFPNPSTQSLIGTPLYGLCAGDLRSYMPRVLALPHNMGNNSSRVYDLNIVEDILLVAMSYYNSNTAGRYYGYLAFDIGY